MVTFSPLNIIWLLWRVQEYFNLEIAWHMLVPYSCICVDVVRCMLETTSVTLMAGCSLKKYLAINVPLWWRRNYTTKYYAKALTLSICMAIASSSLTCVHYFYDYHSLFTPVCHHHKEQGHIFQYVSILVPKEWPSCHCKYNTEYCHYY